MIDHAAHRFGKGRVRHAVENDLRDRPLSGIGFGGCFIIDGGGEAGQGAQTIDRCGDLRQRSGNRADGHARAVVLIIPMGTGRQ